MECQEYNDWKQNHQKEQDSIKRERYMEDAAKQIIYSKRRKR